MAVLADTDYQWIQTWIQVHPSAKTEMKVLNIPKTTWRSVFQTLETYMVSAFTTRPVRSVKAELETITGALTNAQALAIYDAWNAWKTYKRGSG